MYLILFIVFVRACVCVRLRVLAFFFFFKYISIIIITANVARFITNIISARTLSYNIHTTPSTSNYIDVEEHLVLEHNVREIASTQYAYLSTDGYAVRI